MDKASILSAPVRDIAEIEPANVGIKELADLIGEDRKTTIYLLRRGCLPPPDVRLTPRRPKWRASTIRAWLESQQAKPAGVSCA